MWWIAGLSENKANSASALLSWGWAEVGNMFPVNNKSLTGLGPVNNLVLYILSLEGLQKSIISRNLALEKSLKFTHLLFIIIVIYP